MANLDKDKKRYKELKEMPQFQKYMRKGQEAKNPLIKFLYKILFIYYRKKNFIEIPMDINIGGGYTWDILTVLQ